MANVIGAARDDGMGVDERVHHVSARFPAAKVHLYGKAFRLGRKLGHVNVGGVDLAETRRVAGLGGRVPLRGVWADGYQLPPTPGVNRRGPRSRRR